MGYNSAFVSRRLVLLALLAVLVFFAGLGRGAIGDSDEAFYAEAAREMVVSGDWLTPYYNFETRFQKPILYYWFAATAFFVAGIGEAAARVPSAAAGLLLVFVTYRMAKRRFDDDTAWVAGLLAATNFGYVAIGRMALPDLPLAAFITLTTWAAFESLDAGHGRDRRDARRWLVLSTAAAALGMLMKGPVGVLLPALIVLPSLVWRPAPPGGGRVTRARWPWSPSDLALAVAVFLVIAAPWYVAMVGEHGYAYLDRFFIGENVDRFATDRYNEPRSLFFYVPIVLGGLMPWTPFVAGALLPLATVRSRLRDLAVIDGRLLVWMLVPLAFYSISVGKQPRYVLPILPPLAVLAASTIVRLVREERRGVVAACCGITGVLYVGLAAFLWNALPLLVTLDPSMARVTVAAVALAGPAVIIAGVWSTLNRVPLVFALASAVVLLSLNFAVYSAAGVEPVQRMAEMLTPHVHAETPDWHLQGLRPQPGLLLGPEDDRPLDARRPRGLPRQPDACRLRPEGGGVREAAARPARAPADAGGGAVLQPSRDPDQDPPAPRSRHRPRPRGAGEQPVGGQSGKIFPGFSRPWGSNACLMRFISAMASAERLRPM